MTLPKRLSFTTYLLFGLFVFIGLFWYRFPHEAARDFLINQLESSLPFFDFTSSEVTFSLPFSLHVDSILLKKRSQQSAFLELENVVITPKVNDPLNSFRIKGNINNGTITADIVRQPQKHSLEITTFTMADVPFEFEDQNQQNNLAGIMDMRGNYRIIYQKEKAQSEFDTTITIRDGLLKRETPILTLNKIGIDLARLSFSKKNNKLALKEGTVKGNEINANFSGNIQPILPAELITLDLKGKLNAQQALLAENSDVRKQVNQLQKQFKTKAIPFVITGTISNPVFSIEN